MTGPTPPSLAQRLADYTVSSAKRSYPDEIFDKARMCLADWVCVTLGATEEPAAKRIDSVIHAWMGQGHSATFHGSHQTPALAALINGTMAHCLDYDDVHFPSLTHISAPTWAAILALACGTPITQQRLLECFITGYEVGARLGSHGVGPAILDSGWHATGVIGRLSATVASAALLGLEPEQVKQAIAIVATQTSGLTASFGTDSKPMHCGKAAFDAIFSVQLALSGFRGEIDILEGPRSLIDTLVQTNTPKMILENLENDWKIRENALKPYACCGLTHAAIDSARHLYLELGSHGLSHLERIDVMAHPLASKVAAQTQVTTPLAGKFSIAYCTALGLNGYHASAQDFTSERIAQPELARLADKVTLHADDRFAPTAASVILSFSDKTTVERVTQESLGNPGNPMTWEDLHIKFAALTETKIGARSELLFEHLRTFGGERNADIIWGLGIPTHKDRSKASQSDKNALHSMSKRQI